MNGSTRQRVLVVAPFPPRRDGFHGGARAVAKLLDRLADTHQVALVYLREPGEEPVDDVLRSRLPLIEEVERAMQSEPSRLALAIRDVVGLARGNPRWVRELVAPDLPHRLSTVSKLWRPDVVQVEYLVMMKYARSVDRAAPLVLVEHDPALPTARGHLRETRGLARLVAHVEVSAWKRFSRTALRATDAVVVFTERDAVAVEELEASARVVRIPLGADLPDAPLDPATHDPPSLLFVGSFVHPPNVEAAVRLARRIFPPLSERHPELALNIVGYEPPRSVRALATSRVAVHGSVSHVEPYLRQASVVVLPVMSGGGMRVKLIEAMAAGKAVVASGRCAEGLPVVSGKHLLLAEEDDQFVAAIDSLLDDPARRVALGRAGRELVGETLSWTRSARAFGDLYESLRRSPRARSA